LLTLYASWLRIRGGLFEKRWLLWVFVVAVIGPFVANEIGWVAAEVGRQPWIVHPRVVADEAGAPVLDASGMVQYRMEEGLLTRNALSENVSGGEVLTSIVMFGLIYALLFWVWLYVLHQKIMAGPQPVHPPERTTARGLEEAASARALHGAKEREA
jgi:cytochrome d ubiquinol oxidase subunit I